MTAKPNHITEELVEQLAIVSYEQTRIQNGELPMPSWTSSGAMTRFTVKNQVLDVLNIAVPVLLEQGWKPPTEAEAMQNGDDLENRIRSEVCRVVANASNWPDPVATHMLGRDLAEPIDKIAEALILLVREAQAETYKDAADVLHSEARWQTELMQRHQEYRFRHCASRMTEMENVMTTRANQYKEEQ